MRLSTAGAQPTATKGPEPALMMAAYRQGDDVRRWYEWAAATERWYAVAAATERWYAVAAWNDAVARNEAEAAQRASTPPPRPSRPRATTPPPSTVRGSGSSSSWDGVAACESGGNWSANTGNGFEGGLQFTHSTWAAYGGLAFAAHAYQASPAEQIAVADRVASARGSRADWPVCGSR